MTWFELYNNDGYLNGDHIEGFRRGSGSLAMATMKDGQQLRIVCPDEHQLTSTPIPAQPGFELLTAWGDNTEENPVWVDRHPIIAWRIGEVTTAVTPDDENAFVPEYRQCIRYPGGQCVKPGDKGWSSEVKWLVDAKLRITEQRNKKEKDKLLAWPASPPVRVLRSRGGRGVIPAFRCPIDHPRPNWPSSERTRCPMIFL